MAVIHFEEAVYGSFPFWDRGYALLARSPGCRPKWLAEFQQICQRFGEPPSGVNASGAFFALRLQCGPWLIAGVGAAGTDDRGRPGALAFHGLFVADRELGRSSLGPLALAGALRRDWGPETILTGGPWPIEEPSCPLPLDERELGRWGFRRAIATPPHSRPGVEHTQTPGANSEDPDLLAGRIARALRNGRRVVLESDKPIEPLARQVWRLTGARVRRRASVATLAFSLTNGFDLVALPKLEGVELDPSYDTLDTLGQDHSTPPRSRRARRMLTAVAGLALLAVVGVALVCVRNEPTARKIAGPVHAIHSGPPLAHRGAAIDPETRAQAAEALLDLAERFGVAADLSPYEHEDPAALMVHIAERLRYPGPWLADDERRTLHNSNDPEAARALAWDEHLRHFAPDRPLPRDFHQAGDLSWQLATLAWSFHVAPHPELSPVEVPFALVETLSNPTPVRPNHLSEHYPALVEYARFLARLPKR